MGEARYGRPPRGNEAILGGSAGEAKARRVAIDRILDNPEGLPVKQWGPAPAGYYWHPYFNTYVRITVDPWGPTSPHGR